LAFKTVSGFEDQGRGNGTVLLFFVKDNTMEQSAEVVKDTNAVLLECIDRGLKAYSAALPQVVYMKFEQSKKISKQDIPNRLEEFFDVLGSLFGPSHVSVAGSILREIRSNPGLKDGDRIAALVSALMEPQCVVTAGSM
jgi:hypothetical protein